MDPAELNHRERAILGAVAAGRGELLAGCEPDLAVDGGWCDRVAVTRLIVGGWICAARPARVGDLVPAQLTDVARDVFAATRTLTA
ncbi:hypothetical protein GCM10027598_84710 [Amycolatopsis oliviviridis]|uniref:Uncharacterized protein n=1 Tax=Amycolatopsis oliviviridis TaxID=1471590 RepID=A0ABQ3L9J8_9PSEU|nr:hypothetical protein [Amycolatopsis oliviviridis]GHH07635.1 hypothetical protein GCM10017790_14600 [Amycolatopsis oliviviridis]